MSSQIEQTQTGSTATGRLTGRTPAWLTLERSLWGLLVLTLVLDVVTTSIGLQHGLSEGNPVMAAAIARAGIGGLVLAKTLVLAVGACARFCLPQHRHVIPLGLLTPGAFAVLVNTSLLL